MANHQYGVRCDDASALSAATASARAEVYAIVQGLRGLGGCWKALRLVAWSGIDCREDRLAEAAIDILTAHLVRNETGTPAYPKTVLIKGEWKPGATA